MVPKFHTIKVIGFSTAYDICILLDSVDNLVYTVNAHFVPGKFDPGYIEYEIVYHYDFDGE